VRSVKPADETTEQAAERATNKTATDGAHTTAYVATLDAAELCAQYIPIRAAERSAERTAVTAAHGRPDVATVRISVEATGSPTFDTAVGDPDKNTHRATDKTTEHAPLTTASGSTIVASLTAAHREANRTALDTAVGIAVEATNE